MTALEDYLEEYKGVLVIVSHDCFFTDKVTDHLFVFEGNGVVKDFTGTLTDYAEALVEIEELNGEDANTVKDDKKSNYKEDKETRVKRMPFRLKINPRTRGSNGKSPTLRQPSEILTTMDFWICSLPRFMQSAVVVFVIIPCSTKVRVGGFLKM